MYSFDVNPGFILALAAGAFALAFDYLPKLRDWFDSLDPTQKRLLNLGLVLATAVVLFVGDCFSIFDTNLVCDAKGGFDALYMVFVALAVNHGVHEVAKPTPALDKRLDK